MGNNKPVMFNMFDEWQPDENFPEKILGEFKCFWCAKPDVKKTQKQWLRALEQSYQYAISQEKKYKSKGLNTDLSWWRL